MVTRYDTLPTYPRRQILDHGYIQLIEFWGCDERIVEGARMSTGKGFLRWDAGVCPACGNYERTPPCPSCEGKGTVPGDMGLLRRLHTKKHTTPFEMAGMIIEVQAPIMVFREWHRHRTQSYNEKSARYAPLPDDNYMPTTDRLLIASDGKNRQAGTIKEAGILDLDSALAWLAELADVYEHCERVYQSGLLRGVPKELARLCVPVGRYSAMRASAVLLNWLRFLTLRMATDAQWEIREFANAVHDLLVEHFPRTMSLFDEGRG